MTSGNLLDTQTTNFEDLVRNGKIYRVPTFQRDYSWTQEKWEDLWDDISEIYRQSNPSHYMGAIVLQQGTPAKEYHVIDGQQRLTTLSLVAIAVIQAIGNLINQTDQEDEAERNRERQTILRRRYIGDKDPNSLRYSSKLILNDSNDGFYQGNLVNLRQPINRRALKRSDQLLWKAFEYFSQKLDEIQETSWTGEQLSRFLTQTIGQKLLFIQITVQDQLNAYTVFETLNARGVELSSTDLLKNYLFSLFRGPDDLQAAQRQWSNIINTVQMERFPAFLRYYLSLQHTRVRSERLFKLVKESVKDGRQAFELLDKLEEYSSLFIALENPSDVFWSDAPQNVPYIEELELFRVKQAYPTIFAAYKRFSPSDFTRLLKLICVLSFRYTVVGGLNPNDLEKRYNEVAIAISKNEINQPAQVFEALRSVYVSDQKFAQDFAFLSISTKGRQKKLARYILWKLEMDAAERPDLAEDGFTIEHILPESMNGAWREQFTERDADEMTYRVGNFTPLEPSLNRELGNQSYARKREAYKMSCYQLTQQVQAEEWTQEAIAKRQRRLAQRAIYVWKSDFA